jgi:hypothetical protein
MNDEWKVRGRNHLTGKWTTLAQGSREFCEGVFAVANRSPQFPYDRVTLMPASKSLDRHRTP